MALTIRKKQGGTLWLNTRILIGAGLSCGAMVATMINFIAWQNVDCQNSSALLLGFDDDVNKPNLRLGDADGQSLGFKNDDSIKQQRALDDANDQHVGLLKRFGDVGKHRPSPKFGPECPLAVQKNTGLFDTSKSNSASKENFRDVVLLVSCNYAYFDMLQNWEYLARENNLKWAVLALDNTLYEELGPERAISPGNYSVSGAQNYNSGNFNELSCNKMRMALEISEKCGVDVVFSDVDNIFYHNPFEHDLGRLIESRRYDYIYQPNEQSGKPREDRCLHGRPRDESNTGFYFFSRYSEVMQKIVSSTMIRCNESKNFDEQRLFWQEFWNLKRTTYLNNTFHHCSLPEYEDPLMFDLEGSQNSALSVCCMDPFYYPVGLNTKQNWTRNEDPITFHANWVVGKNRKIALLIKSRSDHHGWNNTRIKSTLVIAWPNDRG